MSNQVIKPLFPAFFSRYICRRRGHSPFPNVYTVCARCGVRLGGDTNKEPR